MKKRLPFIISSIIVTIFIFNNSLQSAEASLEDSGFLTALLAKIFEALNIFAEDGTIIFIVRKAAHIFEFALQASLISFCFCGKYKKRIIYILFLGLLTACTDEYLQLYSPGRAGMVSDIFMDFAGTVLGMLFSGLIYKIRRK